MITKLFAPIVLATGAATAVALAPIAAASNSASCEDSGLSSVCTKTGHAAIVATPGSNGSSTFGYWQGVGPTPPVWAMD